MAVVEQGDIFVAWNSGFAQFSAGGAFVSGETRIWLYQISPEGVQKDFWLINVSEFQTLTGGFSDGTHYYGLVNANEMNGGPRFDQTNKIFKVHQNGETVEYHDINLGGFTSSAYGVSGPLGAISDGCGTFWVLYQDPFPTSRWIEYRVSDWQPTGNELSTAFTTSYGAIHASAFKSRTEAVMTVILAGSGSFRHDAVYFKDMATNAETLQYEDTPEIDQRFIMGADYSIPRAEWLGALMIEGTGGDSNNYVYELRQDGTTRLAHSFPWADEEVSDDSGITFSPDGSVWYFPLQAQTSAPLSTEFRVYAVPTGGGSATQLWSSGALSSLDPEAPQAAMRTFNSIYCVKPGFCAGGAGRRRMYTTAIGIH